MIFCSNTRHQLTMVHGEGITEQRGTDVGAGKVCVLVEADEQALQAVDRQWRPCLGLKQRALTVMALWVLPLSQQIQVGAQRLLLFWSQRDPALPGASASDSHHPLLGNHIISSEVTKLCDAEPPRPREARVTSDSARPFSQQVIQPRQGTGTPPAAEQMSLVP